MEGWLHDKLKQVDKRENILNTAGQNDVFKKVAEYHQGKEQTKINKHMEGTCFMCMKQDLVFATIIQICKRCVVKKPKEALLVKWKEEFYGFCYNHGGYETGILHLNVRVCHSCNSRIAKVIREWQAKGGAVGTDPFYQYLKVKLGKDWNILSDPIANARMRK